MEQTATSMKALMGDQVRQMKRFCADDRWWQHQIKKHFRGCQLV